MQPKPTINAQFLSTAYVDTGGVKGALVCDAGRRMNIIISKRAVSEQAASFVNEGLHHRNRQAQDGGNRYETCHEAEDQQDPLLRGQHGQKLLASKNNPSFSMWKIL